MAEDDDYEKLAFAQRLKAAVHFTVGQICEETGESFDLTFNKQFIAALSEATYRYSQNMARDLEMFAKHAKRSTISADDVKLFVRKSPELLEHVCSLVDQQQATSLEKKQKRGKKKTVKGAAAEAPLDEDDESNIG